MSYLNRVLRSLQIPLWVMVFTMGQFWDVSAGGDCSKTSLGMRPLIDLGSDLYNGFEGGLYPGGLNVPPEAHAFAGEAIANSILPLNANGEVDEINGAIVLVTVGMSNTRINSEYFVDMGMADPGKNPRVTLLNGALSDAAANRVANPDDPYWGFVQDKVADAGHTNAQVQIAWVLEATAHPRDGFPDESLKLQGYLEDLARNLKLYFPNIRIVYYSNRIYAGYAVSSLNPEPYAYETGFAVKWAVEEQIKGNPDLNYDPDKGEVVAPYLSWGPDLWADGLTPRSDGLVWECDDLKDDGTHPSMQGGEKVGALILEFFKTDPTTVPWFLEDVATTVDPSGFDLPKDYKLQSNYPNPFRERTNIFYELPERAFIAIRIYNILGQEVVKLVSGERDAGLHTIQWNGRDNYQQPVANGIYFATLWRQAARGTPQLVSKQKISYIR